jgi:Domain of unknown function (DUF932)
MPEVLEQPVTQTELHFAPVVEQTRFSVVHPVWQQSKIGFTVDHEIYDPTEALILAAANWGVYKEKAGNWLKDPQTDEAYYFDDTKKFHVFRDSDNKFLGDVGKDFKLVQNQVGFNWFLPFLEQQEAFIESAGTLGEGQIVWIMARLKEKSCLPVVAGDLVEQRLLLTLCHNTRRSPQATLINSRRSDQIVLSRAGGSQSKANLMKMRQTQSVDAQMLRVGEKVQLARKAFEQDLAAYQQLAAKYVSPQQIRASLRLIFSEVYSSTVEKNGIVALRYPDLEDYKPVRLILENLRRPSLQIPFVGSTNWALYLAIGYYFTYQAKENRRGCDRTKWEAQLEALWFVDKNSVLDRALRILNATGI